MPRRRNIPKKPIPRRSAPAAVDYRKVISDAIIEKGGVRVSEAPTGHGTAFARWKKLGEGDIQNLVALAEARNYPPEALKKLILSSFAIEDVYRVLNPTNP